MQEGSWLETAPWAVLICDGEGEAPMGDWSSNAGQQNTDIVLVLQVRIRQLSSDCPCGIATHQ